MTWDERVASARARGVHRYDALRFRFVERLVELAAETPEGAERLRGRALDRLTALEEDFTRAQAEAARVLETRSDSALLAAFEAGDFRAVLQARRSREDRSGAQHAVRLSERLSERVTDRTSAPPPPPGAGMLEFAERLYHERCGEALTRRAVAGLRDELPVDAGPYHGPTVAASALESLGERAPLLLRAWLQRLRNADALRV